MVLLPLPEYRREGTRFVSVVTMESLEQQTPSPLALKQGYEPPDISVKGLLVFLVIFLVMAVVIHVGIWFLNESLLHRRRNAEAVKSAVPVVQQFATPDVQPTETHNQMPWQDLADLRHAEASRFQQLGWKADGKTGSAVIPDSIVTQLAQRYKAKGPAGNAPPQATPGTTPASASSAPATGPTSAPATEPTTASPEIKP